MDKFATVRKIQPPTCKRAIRDFLLPAEDGKKLSRPSETDYEKLVE